MLMAPDDRPAVLYFEPNSFRVLSPGDHVLCAVTGARIPLTHLHYWNVAKQEAYANAEVATRHLAPPTTRP